MTMRKIFLAIFILSSAIGCTTNATSTPAPSPTPEPITVAVSPVLGNFWEEILHACAWGQPQTLLVIEEAPSLYPDVAKVDLTLWWGIPNEYPHLREPGAAVFSLGAESIAIVIHEENPLTSLSVQDLQKIYNARVETWRQVSEKNALGEIQVWTYPYAHPLRNAFDLTVLPPENLTSYARLAPSPEAMLEAIQENPSAIGYIPNHFFFKDSEVKKIPLQPQPAGFRQLILGITTEEPEGNMAALLHCLQTNFP